MSHCLSRLMNIFYIYFFLFHAISSVELGFRYFLIFLFCFCLSFDQIWGASSI
jgi:hypothetical protein